MYGVLIPVENIMWTEDKVAQVNTQFVEKSGFVGPAALG